MSPELEKKVIDDLMRSGFGAEMVAARTAIDHDWKCQPGESFFDFEEQKVREIDLSLFKGYYNKDAKIDLEYHIIAEVKTSSKPWIVLSRSINPEQEPEGWSNPSAHAFLPLPPNLLAATINETSLASRM